MHKSKPDQVKSMPHRWLLKAARIIQRWFFTFLDISGILLGIFLIALGWWSISGRSISRIGGYLIMVIGIAAFFIHVGHYFQLKITRWVFGSKDYFRSQPQ